MISWARDVIGKLIFLEVMTLRMILMFTGRRRTDDSTWSSWNQRLYLELPRLERRLDCQVKQINKLPKKPQTQKLGAFAPMAYVIKETALHLN